MAGLAEALTGAVGDPVPEAAPKLMSRDRPEPDAGRAELVKKVLKDVAEAKKHWAKDFKRMRRDMAFASGKQWPGQTEEDPRFMVNLVQRIIKTTVSSLYAKNPTVTMQRRPRLDYLLWDGKAETAQQAAQLMQAAAQGQLPPGDPAIAQALLQAQALIQDIQQGAAKRTMIDKIGKTLVACAQYYIDEGTPSFKLQMKQMIRRARTTAVGYVKLDFQREMDLSPRQSSEIADMANRLATIGQLTADLQDGEFDANSADAEKLKLAIEAIRSEPEQIVREGVIFNFPHSTRIIPSIGTEKLMGWIGAEWIAEEIMLSPARIKAVYGVDVGKSYTGYKSVAGSPERGEQRRDDSGKGALACVYVVYDKNTGLKMTVCEGYPDFLEEPGSPDIFIEQFFPYFAVTFNDVEDESRLFPSSDVTNMMHIQMEYNRTKEAQRQHRYANRPLYFAKTGTFEDEETKSLASHAAHDIIMLNALENGRPASDLIAPVPKIGVDPNMYETASLFQDMQRVTGNQEANIGGTGNGTATESSIAENSREGSIGLDSDDLDDMLTALFRAMSEVMLTNLSEETVKEIVGPGAVWPQLSRGEIAKEMWLSTKAGSSGRPNQSRDAATFERIYPLLVQTPGISPRWLAERAIRIADDNTDIEDAIVDGLPSIMAQNSMAQPSTGDPATDPSAQGSKGAGNDQKPAPPGGTSQPAYPGAGAGGNVQ